MDFNYSPADEAFRAELRAWLELNSQYSVPALGPLADEPEGGWEATLRWHRKLYEGGFNEVFFEDVRIPLANVVGQKNQGWQVAMTTLMFERSGGEERIMATQADELALLAARLTCCGRPASEDARVRQQIGQFAIEAAALRYTAFRQLTRQLKGLPPGPEASLIKIGASELGLRMAAFAMELLGSFATLEPGDSLAYDDGQWSHRMLAARGPMIYSGTNEIQRNILGERVLGLPRA